MLTEAEAALIELEKKRLVVHLPMAVAVVVVEAAAVMVARDAKVEAEVRPYRDTRARAV